MKKICLYQITNKLKGYGKNLKEISKNQKAKIELALKLPRIKLQTIQKGC